MKTIGRAAVVAALLFLRPPSGASSQELCPTSPLDPPPSGGAVINTCYPGEGTAPAGSTSIMVGRPSAGTPIAAGDLLLIMQMQDTDINTDNDGNYGDGEPRGGVPGPNDPGQGFLSANDAGCYEYVVAIGPVVPGPAGEPDRASITGAGAGGGLLYSYRSEPYAASPYGHGQRRFQLIRVPRYANLTLPAGGLTCHPWNGECGGVLAFDVTGTLDLYGQTLSVAGRGFRGGYGERLLGSDLVTNAEYRSTTGAAAHGNKGEGIAGTPRYVTHPLTGKKQDTGVEGYPDGSRARGAPANAGGGATDGYPHSNNDSAGGGGGGNGGTGGNGGNSISGLPTGGFGGSAFAADKGIPIWSAGRVVMGGGGGSGSRNDSSAQDSSGVAGGGIVLVRAGLVAASGVIDASGASASYSGNDGGGGGGAGGSIVLVSSAGGWQAAIALARGGNGADSGAGTSIIGPGGGGGGGVILANAPIGFASTGAGLAGTTDTGAMTFGATQGTPGTEPPGTLENPFIDPREIPGAHSGADCANNNAPTNIVPGPQSTLQDIALVFSASALPPNSISVSDPDAGAAPVEVTLIVTPGTLSLGTATGLLFSTGDGADDLTVTFQGTLDDVNAALEGLSYVPPPGYTGPAVLTLITNDLGNTGSGGPRTDADEISIEVGNVNDPPFNLVPGPQTTLEDTALVFRPADGNAIAVTDVDAGASPVRVSITAERGILTLGGTSGLIFIEGDGSADATMTFTGTMAAINVALDGMMFQPAPNFNSPASASVAIVTDDQGASGLGGPLQDTDTIQIAVTAVNDPPVAADDSYAVAEDTPLDVSPGVLANDTDVDGDTLAFVLVAPPASGTLTFRADGSFTYVPAPDFFGVDAFTYRAYDGTTMSAPATVWIHVASVIDPNRIRAGYCNASAGVGDIRISWLLALAACAVGCAGLVRHRPKLPERRSR